MYDYSYNDNTKELTIYENDCVLATISDVEEEQSERMFEEVVYELRGENYEQYRNKNNRIFN